MAKKTAPGGNLQELKTQLKNKDLGRLYIFHGEEVFLLHHYLEQMKKQLLDALTESFNFHRMNSETFDLQTFADAVENLPMMAEHTMVQVDEVDLDRVHVGDSLKVICDRYPDTELSGTVLSIAGLGVQKQNATYYDVKLSISTSLELLPGMNATVYLP